MKNSLDRINKNITGTDPITKGYFIINWSLIVNGFFGDTAPLQAVGNFYISKVDNPFYTALIKTPLLLQDHPLSCQIGIETFNIKITSANSWNSAEEGIYLKDVCFEFLDNLDYFKSLYDFKINNFL